MIILELRVKAGGDDLRVQRGSIVMNVQADDVGVRVQTGSDEVRLLASSGEASSPAVKCCFGGQPCTCVPIKFFCGFYIFEGC